MTQEEMMQKIDDAICQKEMIRQELNEVTKEMGELLKRAVEDIKFMTEAETEYICEVCAHYVKCQTCKHHDLCDDFEDVFGECPALVATPCNGCDFSKGTNFLWRGYVNTKFSRNSSDF